MFDLFWESHCMFTSKRRGPTYLPTLEDSLRRMEKDRGNEICTYQIHTPSSDSS